MKKIFQSLFFTLLTIASHGQVIDFGKLATKAQLDSVARLIGKPPVVTPPVVSIPNCKSGPDIKEVYNVTKTGLTFNFFGDQVFGITVGIVVGSDTIKREITPDSDRPSIGGFSLSPGTYQLIIKGSTCKSLGWSKMLFNVPKETGSVDPVPPIENPVVPSDPGSQQFGTFTTVVGNRTYTHILHPDLVIKFQPDGSIVDQTPGVTIVNGVTRYQGRNRFYMLNHAWYETSDQKPKILKTDPLPAGALISVIPFDTELDYATLRDERGGWIRQSTHNTTTVRYLYFQSHGPDESPYLAMPKWHEISAKLIVPLRKDGDFNGKLIATSLNNSDDNVEDWHRSGYITQRNHNANGQFSFATYQAHGIADNLKGLMTDEAQSKAETEFYNAGYSRARDTGCSNSIITTQLSEDEIHHKFRNGNAIIDKYYKGVSDYCNSIGVSDVKKMPGYGEYGLDGTLHFTDFMKEDHFKESLTNHLFDSKGADGWRNGTSDFYARQTYNFRNVNHATYFRDSPMKIIFGSVHLSEMLKLGSKTYQGQDREVNAIGYSMPYYESESNNVSNHTIIRFPNGNLMNSNDYTPACPSLLYRHGLFSALITNGYAMWDVESVGTDSTRANLIPNQQGNYDYIKWWPKGGSGWEKYTPGKNGAPELSSNGVTTRMSALPSNAAFAGVEALRDVLDRVDDKIELVSYKSSNGDFSAQGGDAGLNLNGHGPINRNNFDAYRLKMKGGFLFKCTGKTGKVVYFYCNEKLLADQYEILQFENFREKVYGTQVYKFVM